MAVFGIGLDVGSTSGALIRTRRTTDDALTCLTSRCHGLVRRQCKRSFGQFGHLPLGEQDDLAIQAQVEAATARQGGVLISYRGWRSDVVGLVYAAKNLVRRV